MVATANTVMRGGVTTVTSTPTSPTDTTASRASVISSTVSVSFQPSSRGARACGSSAAPHLERQVQPSRSTQPSARTVGAYLELPHARACGSSAAPHLERQVQPSRSTQPSARTVGAYLAPPHARACGNSAAPHLERQSLARFHTCAPPVSEE